MKILVVGGVAGGATAIARLRRLDEEAQIILFEKGAHVSFANCGLPYYIGGQIARRDALFVTTEEEIEKKYAVDIRTRHEVLSIQREEKTLTVKNLETGEVYQESYDRLLLSTGSRPFVPPAEGVDADNVFTLWSIPDVDAIDAYLRRHQPKQAVVVGGGFIGLEMTENLVDRGLHVHLVEKSDQVMPPLDKDMARLVENHLCSKGVHLHLGVGFQGTQAHGTRLLLDNGETLATDLTLLAIGVRPQNELAKAAGLSLNERGGIRVDARQQTSDPSIYAVGDVVGVEDYVLGGEIMVPLAGPANKQGRLAAANLLNQKEETYTGTMGTSVAKVFDLTVASVGANEKTLQRKGLVYKKDYYAVLLHPMSHAGYYPGALPMTIKLLFGIDGKILGAQIIGYDGVDKRIDVIASAIHFHGTVEDLTRLELAYAPPYSSAKDPVNYAGYIACNVLDGRTDPVLYREYLADPTQYQLLDIREQEETLSGQLENSLHIPLTELRERLNELPRDRHYLVYCAVGLRGYLAERVLHQKGYRVSNLLGGYRSAMDHEERTTPLSMDTGQEKILPRAPQDTRASATPSSTSKEATDEKKIELLDVCGMSCPGPIVEVSKAMAQLPEGGLLRVRATDPGFVRDIESWCQNTGNTLLEKSERKGSYEARLQKGSRPSLTPSANVCAPLMRDTSKEKTMIVFDGDLDKAIAAFIIATGAASMGNKVHMFFTFWGLSLLRKEKPERVKKDGMSRLFSSMLPKGSRKLGLSKMNFFGAGAAMIRSVMKKKGVASLEELIQQALDMGVELTACQMTMDIMGLKKEELLDGVQIGGVASMLHDSDQSNMNLFIS